VKRNQVELIPPASASRPAPAAILAVVGFGVFVAADDLTVVATMLRQIIFDLEIPLPAGLDQAAWIVNAYLIGYVVVMPFIGRLSDILGRRAVYVGALILFLAGSIWVPFAKGLNSFIIGRVLTALRSDVDQLSELEMAILSEHPAQPDRDSLRLVGSGRPAPAQDPAAHRLAGFSDPHHMPAVAQRRLAQQW
jgi:hypothetical protein